MVSFTTSPLADSSTEGNREPKNWEGSSAVTSPMKFGTTGPSSTSTEQYFYTDDEPLGEEPARRSYSTISNCSEDRSPVGPRPFFFAYLDILGLCVKLIHLAKVALFEPLSSLFRG